MRAVLALTLCIAGLATTGTASAADFSGSRAVYAVRAPQLVRYDNEPGVYVRAYWSTPWQNRHYYPFTGKKPKSGRAENLHAVRAAPVPAEPFYREWSTLSLYPPEPVVEQREHIPLPTK